MAHRLLLIERRNTVYVYEHSATGVPWRLLWAKSDGEIVIARKATVRSYQVREVLAPGREWRATLENVISRG